MIRGLYKHTYIWKATHTKYPKNLNDKNMMKGKLIITWQDFCVGKVNSCLYM